MTGTQSALQHNHMAVAVAERVYCSGKTIDWYVMDVRIPINMGYLSPCNMEKAKLFG